MECGQTAWLDTGDYMRQLHRKIVQRRIPIAGSIELTHRCNLSCVHCYLGGQQSQMAELTTAQWYALLDQITAAGCLFLLITGGESLLRKDFADIYIYAKRCGLLVTVFTNGTLITDEICELFREWPPQIVEVSVYGATATTYERITEIPGSYRRCLDGLERLTQRHIPLRFKTILMTLNQHEFEVIEQMAENYGVGFRFDGAIMPRLNGDHTPIILRVPPDVLVEKEFVDPERARQWTKLCDRMRHAPPVEKLYQCGAGLDAFHIDPYGRLQPCLTTATMQYDLTTGNFDDGWQRVLPDMMAKTPDSAYACNQCEKRAVCGPCPAVFHLETGREDRCSEYACALGQARWQAIYQQIEKYENTTEYDEHKACV